MGSWNSTARIFERLKLYLSIWDYTWIEGLGQFSGKCEPRPKKKKSNKVIEFAWEASRLTGELHFWKELIPTEVNVFTSFLRWVQGLWLLQTIETKPANVIILLDLLSHLEINKARLVNNNWLHQNNKLTLTTSLYLSLPPRYVIPSLTLASRTCLGSRYAIQVTPLS